MSAVVRIITPGGLTLEKTLDFVEVAWEVGEVKPDVVWIDSSINAVSDSEVGIGVKAMFNNLSALMRQYDLMGIAFSLHTRKRAQGVPTP